MTTVLKLTCSGCAQETESKPIRKTFVSMFGNKKHGLGHLTQPNLDDCVPDGWVGVTLILHVLTVLSVGKKSKKT